MSETAEFSPRAFFVQGLPQDETTTFVNGRQMHDLIRKFIVVSSASSTTKLQYQLFFDRNVHRKIRDGSFLILFDSPEIAKQVWTSLRQSSSTTNDDDESDCTNNSEDDDEFIRIKIPLHTLLPSTTAATTQSKNDDVDADKSSLFFTLAISWSAGKLRDHFFPLLPYSVRRNIFMDPTATFSLTDMHSANRMAKLLCEAILVGSSSSSSTSDKISVCDAFACVGGNTFGFLQQKFSRSVDVTSIELDPQRYSMLQKNYNLIMMKNQRVFEKNVLALRNGCALEFLATKLESSSSSSNEKKCFDILFFDPPWGGPTEMKQESKNNNNNTDHDVVEEHTKISVNDDKPSLSLVPGFPPFLVANSVFDSFAKLDVSEQDETTHQKVIHFEALISSLVLSEKNRNIASIIALKLPSEKWCEEVWMQNLVNKCVGLSSSLKKEENDGNGNHVDDEETRERVFPFLFNFGASVRLLCFVQNSIVNPISGIVSNRTLDDLVERIWRFNVVEGFREMKPRFFDFEKKRWIELKKWLGSKE